MTEETKKELARYKRYSAALEKEVKSLRKALKIYEDAMTYALANSIDADAFEGSFSSAFEKVENLKGGEE